MSNEHLDLRGNEQAVNFSNNPKPALHLNPLNDDRARSQTYHRFVTTASWKFATGHPSTAQMASSLVTNELHQPALPPTVGGEPSELP